MLLDLHSIEATASRRLFDRLRTAVAGNWTAQRGPSGVCQMVLVFHLVAGSGFGRKRNSHVSARHRRRECDELRRWNQHEEAYVDCRVASLHGVSREPQRLLATVE